MRKPVGRKNGANVLFAVELPGVEKRCLPEEAGTGRQPFAKCLVT
jgi:hypothetical protein